ncbi:MAG: ankyrin repeat domain-containing protein, partial [Salinibacter sp.]|uniref:ankyrin repeat domain-containing protein n=1 Tax=Salinibacter sp. TaxID=2065818 RepID=UPI0035D4CBBB
TSNPNQPITLFNRPNRRHDLHNFSDLINGSAETVKLLLEEGVDVDFVPTSDSWDPPATPLCEAASEGHAEVVSLLLEEGADYSVKDDEGRTPLQLAAAAGLDFPR